MSISKVFARLGLTAVAIAWGAFATFAADPPAPTAPPGVVGAAPVSAGVPGCESCKHGVAKPNCTTCGKLFSGSLHKDKKAPYPVTLCPGSCFGYFQTQWRKWDDVCPYPYLGIGVNDAPKQPGGLTPPRPLDPKMSDPKMTDPKKVGNGLPPIPVAPNKFTP